MLVEGEGRVGDGAAGLAAETNAQAVVLENAETQAVVFLNIKRTRIGMGEGARIIDDFFQQVIKIVNPGGGPFEL